MEARASNRQLRLLSAGCSSGEEAYTLSILTRERLQDSHPPFEVSIRGLDINPRVIVRARAASYSSWALRETPEAIQKQYFSVVGREYILSKAIRDSVQFEEANLVADDSWAPESLDVIFCRNVLMYFTTENAQRVVQRFARALAPGGYLFLGHAENLRGLSLDFELRHTHSTFYYQRKPISAETALTALARSSCSHPPPRAALALDWASTWLETVQRSSDRIVALTAKNAEPARAARRRGAGEPSPRARTSTRTALAGKVRGGLGGPARASREPGEGRRCSRSCVPRCSLTAAACRRRSSLAPRCLRSTGSTLALTTSEHCVANSAADSRTAIEYNQIAAYLEPSFAMPHLHWGLIARRTGDRSTALRELTQAVLLLQREDASRLLLFGGGFSREGLIGLCQSELNRLGG